eukprot:44006_1
MAGQLFTFWMICTYWSLMVKCEQSIICINSESYTVKSSNSTDDPGLAVDCTNTTSDIDILNETVACPPNTDCVLQCMDCESLTLHCPNNTNCNIQCHAASSCASVTVDARHSHNLIIDCIGHESCENINMYCPVHGINNSMDGKHCALHGSDGSTHSNLNVYAMNGWKDVDFIQYNASINRTSNNNKMHCNYVNNEYMDSCLLSMPWNCMDPTHVCSSFASYYTTTGIPDPHVVISTPWIVGGAGLIVLIVALCCLCVLTQYRRHREDRHKIESKKEQKVAMYGADVMDDTLYVGDDDEIEIFDITEHGGYTLHGIRVVADEDDVDEQDESYQKLKLK